jgi:hypothetical protein
MRLRRWAITAVTVLSVSAVAACGSGDSNSADNADNPGESSTSPTTTDASTGSGGSGSGDSGSSDSGSGGTNVDALTARALGAAMAKAATEAGSAHMVMTTGSSSGTATMTGDIAGLGQKIDAVQMGMKMKIPGTGTAQLRIVDSAFYMKIPGLGLGSKWLKVPLDDPSNPLGSLYGQLATFTDPDALAAQYSAFQKFTDLGTETVDGVEARHYKVTVDTAKSLKASGLDKIGGIPLRELLKSMPKTTRSDLWLDGDNLIVKMTSDSSSGVEIHYSKWGQPVHVAAPPKGQVQDFSI